MSQTTAAPAAEPAAICVADQQEPWWLQSASLARAGFVHAFCHHGRPDDISTCGMVAPRRTLRVARQVHGRSVALAHEWPDSLPPEADAVISIDPSMACAIRTADCAPVLVACLRSGAIAAVHAGWRGIECGVIGAAVDAMARELGAVPSQMMAAIGPCARACHYEIGEEVASAMAGCGCASAVVRRHGAVRPFLDMAQAAAVHLAHAGVPRESIDADFPCSIESPWCPSHRREPNNPSRMLSIIVPSGPAPRPARC